MSSEIEVAKAAMASYWSSPLGDLSEIANAFRGSHASLAQLHMVRAWLPINDPASVTGQRLAQLRQLMDGLVAEAGQQGGKLRPLLEMANAPS